MTESSRPRLHLEWGWPLLIEYTSTAAYRFARTRSEPKSHLLLKRLEPGHSAGSFWDVASWRVEAVRAKPTAPCTVCGKAISGPALHALGYPLHERCLNSPVPGALAAAVLEAFELMAEPVVYVRSWREALAQFGRK